MRHLIDCTIYAAICGLAFAVVLGTAFAVFGCLAGAAVYGLLSV